MKGAVVVFLFCLLPATSTAGFGLPWFNTRPKPFLFDQPSAASRAAAHGPVVRPIVKRRDVSWQRDARKSNEPAQNTNRSAGTRKDPAHSTGNPK